MFANLKLEYAELETNYAVVQGQLAVEKATVNALEFSLAKQNDEIKQLEKASKEHLRKLESLNAVIAEYNKQPEEVVKMDAESSSDKEAIEWLRKSAPQLLQ